MTTGFHTSNALPASDVITRIAIPIARTAPPCSANVGLSSSRRREMPVSDESWRELFRECPECLLRRHENCDGWLFWCVCRDPNCLPSDEDRA